MRRGVRRPLVALVALVLALVVGYVARGADSDGGGGDTPSRPPAPSSGASSTR
ncbi:hypothetical protein [Jatrophihabitans endophyticus]|uniref:hypothetical protein n=1 Tax=Jatrophihabitans endophyticus TaxID=1206085 RepID=UPI00135648E9|nr:hypothetical protein [Jatrophihabitans endophyticus]